MTAKRQLFRVAPLETPDGIIDEFTLPHPFEDPEDVQPWVGRPKDSPLPTASPTPAAGEFYANPATSKVKFGTPPESVYFRMLTTDLTTHNWVPRLDVELEGVVDGENKVFFLPELPADYEQIEILYGKPRSGLDLVVSLPTGPEFTIAGKVVTIGIAPYPEEGAPRGSYFYEDVRLGYENTTGVPIPAASGQANARYARFSALATRLLSDYGGDFVLIRRVLQNYDPSAGQPGYSTTHVGFRGVLIRDDKAYNQPDGAQESGMRVIAPALSVVPKIGDQIDVGGQVMNVNAVRAVKPDGVSPVVYHLGVAA